jgi:hypothetical protein
MSNNVTSVVVIRGPMVIVGPPVSDKNLIRMPALAQGNLRKPLPGVKVLEEMPFEIVFNNWRNQRFPVNALMEVNGFLIIKNGKWEVTAKSLRV